MRRWIMAFAALVIGFFAWRAAGAEEAWRRHTIDSSSRGADGVRLADANGDRRLDIVTGWEEGGQIRLCLAPATQADLRRPWPAVLVGTVKSPEDAVLVDLDGDGALDVVSATEGNERTVYAHFAPRDKLQTLTSEAWKTVPIAATKRQSQWMFTLPLDIDGQHGIDLVVGSKGPQAMVGWLQSPANSRDGAAWRLHPLCEAGWIMSLRTVDLDGDGDLDILFSDRKGKRSGIKWLENPGQLAKAWPEHAIAAAGREVMFLDIADLDGDGLMDIVAAVQPRGILCVRNLGRDGRRWETHQHAWPDATRAGTPKAVRVADLNLDGRPDVALTCENAAGERSGVWWVELSAFDPQRPVVYHDVGGAAGVKFDLVEALDLDGDGDLDLVTCEERDNLGVVWYENPLRRLDATSR
jgi:hypothetical protein